MLIPLPMEPGLKNELEFSNESCVTRLRDTDVRPLSRVFHTISDRRSSALAWNYAKYSVFMFIEMEFVVEKLKERINRLLLGCEQMVDHKVI